MQFHSADFIFDGYQFLPKGNVICTDDDGQIVDIVQEEIEDTQHHMGLLMPGMINAHCHLELSACKGIIAKGSGLVDFLISISSKRNQFTQEAIYEAIEHAENEMLQNGIVAVGDISNGLDSLPQKQRARLHYHTFVECFGLLDVNAMERIHASIEILKHFTELHSSSLVLHAPYSVSERMIHAVNEISGGKISSIHNQECDDENELFISGTGSFLKLFKFILNDINFFKPSGLSSLQTYLPKLSKPQKLILVHNTVSNEADIKFAQALHHQLYWCLCPNANLYIENKLPNISMMQKQACKIVLGTDSLASNDSLSIVDEIITLQKNLPSIPLADKLKWATSNGAEALDIDNKFGSFEVGKRPGIINITNVKSENELPLQLEVFRIC